MMALTRSVNWVYAKSTTPHCVGGFGRPVYHDAQPRPYAVFLCVLHGYICVLMGYVGTPSGVPVRDTGRPTPHSPSPFLLGRSGDGFTALYHESATMQNPNTNPSVVSIFTFQPSFDVRVVDQNGNPWFVALDVCKALELTNSRMAVQSLDDDEKTDVSLTYTSSNGVNQRRTATIISESGLYTLILRCREATTPGTVPHRFRKWVTNEVLPSIRRTGSYSIPQPPAPVAKREYLTNNDMLNLKRLVWQVSNQMKFKDSFIHAVWYCLRNVTGVPSPAKFEVQHLPAMAQELKRIMGIVEQYTEVKADVETQIIKHCIRQKNAAVLPHLLNQIRQTVDDNQGQIQQAINKSLLTDCAALLNRAQPPKNLDYDDCNEPQ